MRPPAVWDAARGRKDARREKNKTMITTRRGRAKKRRAEEEEPDDDSTEALVRTTAALKDAHKTAREGREADSSEGDGGRLIKSGARRAGDALRLPRERICGRPEGPSRAPRPRKRRRPPPRSSSSRRPTKLDEKRRRSSRPTAGSLDAALRVAALKRDLEIAESKAQDIPAPPPAPSGPVLDALEVKPSVEKLRKMQNALSQATTARADLAKERAVTTRLRAEIDQSVRRARGAALERESARLGGSN